MSACKTTGLRMMPVMPATPIVTNQTAMTGPKNVAILWVPRD
jgi:hypothetical protein